MNKLECLIYNLVKRNPRLKLAIRDAYQLFWDLISDSRSYCMYPMVVRKGYFFGFHDKSPWSPDDRMLLGHQYVTPLRMPLHDDTVNVGYFSGPSYREFTVVGKSCAWNWHQGAMLQWLGLSSNIIFNNFNGKSHVAHIVDMYGKDLSVLKSPIAAVSPDGKTAVSYSFARLRGSPYGYAYANGNDPEADRLIPQNDGIHVVNIRSNERRLLFSVADLVKIKFDSSMKGAFHYISHCQFSPSGKRFKFLHRWVLNQNQHWTRMFSCDTEGKNLHLFPTHEMVSHVAWRDDKHLVAYARTRDYGDHYYLFEDLSDHYEIIGNNAFSSDGHPSFSKDGCWMLTDTYPDRSRKRFLILYDIQNEKRYDLAKLYSPRWFVGRKPGELISCDLHPRWSRNNRMICFDSAHEGERSLCTLSLDRLVLGRKPQ